MLSIVPLKVGIAWHAFLAETTGILGLARRLFLLNLGRLFVRFYMGSEVSLELIEAGY